MNRRQKRMEDARAAKDKKMKKVAIALSVVLVAVLAFEVPKLLHSSSTSSAPAVTTTTTPAGATSAPTTGVPATATPTTAPGTAAAALTPTSSKLPNSDTLPRVGKGQLFAFSHFTAKDPFVQQVVAQPTAASASSSTSAAAPKSPTTASQAAKVSHPQSTRVLAVRGAARISVNGRIQVVRVGASFPSANPLFKLVSVTNGVARIGIASGSYSSGARTVSLGAGRTLTLVDTADGIRYQLRLLTR